MTISFRNVPHSHLGLGALQKEKNSGAPGRCPVCLLVKTALPQSDEHTDLVGL